MRYFLSGTFICVCLLVVTTNIFGQGVGCNTPAAGQRHGIYYTDCFPWQSGDGTIGSPAVNNDTERLRRAINASHGKLIFNENNYLITDDLPLHSYLIIEGIGNNPTLPSEFPATRIIQKTSDKSIFTIGPADHEISIRDIALVGSYFPDERGDDCINGAEVECVRTNIGILAQGEGASSIFTQFSNIRFENFAKGIFVNGTDGGNWQFDNVRLDHSTFVNCTIGVHVNSMNSGWSITGINMLVPSQLDETTETLGFYFERSTYTSLNLVIGNGGNVLDEETYATAFIKIVRHGNISIQNSVSEGFDNDVVIEGVNNTTRDFPIALINNHFMHGLVVDNSTIMSTGNQFGFDPPGPISYVARVIAKGYSQIYSIGDKFCFEGQSCQRVEEINAQSVMVDYSNYKIESPAHFVHHANVNNSSTTLPLTLRKGNFSFDISRSDINGSLTFTSNTQGAGFTFNANYSEFKIKDGNINFDNGTITLGSIYFGNLNLGTTSPGTLYFCSDCYTTNPCTGPGGGGAIAKRLGTTWVCN